MARVNRSKSGMSLLELVVSCILLGFVFAAIGELIMLNTLASSRLSNKMDGQVGCSRAIRRICEDIRQSRAIGNIYSTNARNIYADPTDTTDGITSVAPAAGFPVAPWPATPYVLSPQTLILQQPVLFEDQNNPQNRLNGFPVRLVAGSIRSAPQVPSVNKEYVDTIVYQVVQDPQNTSQFTLQIARFSGFPLIAGSKLRTPLNPPQTVLRGIIGPIDPNNPGYPAVFQYLKSPEIPIPMNIPTPDQALTLSGVSINLEVQPADTDKQISKETAFGHAVAYLKNSRFVRLVND